MTLVDTNKAVDYFMAKLEFTTGPVELKGWMETDENINIIDVRYPDDFAAGHIPGSINLPKDRWGTFEGLSSDKVNIIYCYSTVCHIAASASLYFAEHGYHVMELDGGFDQWKKHEFPIET
jgi:rhodanese-related sulfurtransferase